MPAESAHFPHRGPAGLEMARSIRIGNAQAFWGDNPDAPATLALQAPDLDFLTLDYLAEVSLSIMAIQKEKRPEGGFARDFVEAADSLAPIWLAGRRLRVITNAGGLNPVGCAEACVAALKKAGASGVKVGVVTGDDVLQQARDSEEPEAFRDLETGEGIGRVRDRLVTANAYLGARSAAEVLRQGADIVITGRMADPSLAVAACLAEFEWRLDDFDRIAAATVGGHLIECGTQVTGGISTDWMELDDPAGIGFPIAEIDEDGRLFITKPAGTGGRVSEQTVKEQLLYEIGDPARYLSPDATVSFLGLRVEQVGRDRVSVSGARGFAPPETYKVSATYRDGYRAEGTLVIVGPEAPRRARRAGEVMLERMRRAGFKPERSQVEILGAGDSVPGALTRREDLQECVLRVAVADQNQKCVEYFSRQVAPLVTSGPSGVTGYGSGRPTVRPVFGYWPCLISARQVTPRVRILEV
jgi:hypothetical protein